MNPRFVGRVRFGRMEMLYLCETEEAKTSETEIKYY